MLLCRSIHVSFVDFVLFYFHFIIKWQQKLSLFLTQKRMAVEPENQEDGLEKDGEAGEVSLTLSQPPENQEATASKFHPAWKNVYTWLQCDEEKV